MTFIKKRKEKKKYMTSTNELIEFTLTKKKKKKIYKLIHGSLLALDQDLFFHYNHFFFHYNLYK